MKPEDIQPASLRITNNVMNSNTKSMYVTFIRGSLRSLFPLRLGLFIILYVVRIRGLQYVRLTCHRSCWICQLVVQSLFVITFVSTTNLTTIVEGTCSIFQQTLRYIGYDSSLCTEQRVNLDMHVLVYKLLTAWGVVQVNVGSI